MTEKPEILKQGKIPEDILKDLLTCTASNKDTEDIIIGAETGEDAAVVKGNKRIIISADPITFTGENIGIYTVAVNCNDIVAMGGIPKYLTTTILIPPGTHKDKLQSVFKEIGYYARKAGIHWIGGHTEVTDAAARLIVSGQVVGFFTGRLTPSSGAKPGDVIVMTKWAGLEGTTILAREMPEITRNILGEKAHSEVLNWITDPGISILTEGKVLRGINISSAHDPTEGGIATGIHEIALRSGTGAMIYKDSVFIREETKALAKYFNIDPLGLLSSGVFIFTARPEEAQKASSLLKNKGIDTSIIGVITDKDKEVLITSKEGTIKLPVFTADEIIKALKKKTE